MRGSAQSQQLDNAITRRTATGDDCHLVDQAPLFIWRHRASCKFVAPMIAGLEPTRTAANVANPRNFPQGLPTSRLLPRNGKDSTARLIGITPWPHIALEPCHDFSRTPARAHADCRDC